jgi:acyl-ACP thioesterase
MAYEFESRVRYSEVDENKELMLTSLIDYFQDCSTFQSEALGIGIDFMQQQGKAWMILSWQVEVLRRPRLGEKIISRTWPYGFKAFYGYRNYALLDEAGHYLAKANSVWALIDVESGHPARALSEYIAGYELEPRLEMAEFSRKIQMPAEGRSMEAFSVVRNQLDSNHHVNNGQYIQMAEAYLPEDFETGFFRVEYRKQARLHDQIVPLVHEENGTYTVSLCDTQGSPYALVEFLEKK